MADTDTLRHIWDSAYYGPPAQPIFGTSNFGSTYYKLARKGYLTARSTTLPGYKTRRIFLRNRYSTDAPRRALEYFARSPDLGFSSVPQFVRRARFHMPLSHQRLSRQLLSAHSKLIAKATVRRRYQSIRRRISIDRLRHRLLDYYADTPSRLQRYHRVRLRVRASNPEYWV